MKRWGLRLAAIVLLGLCNALDARAERISYYRVGGGITIPSSDLEQGTGWNAGLGVSVPFAHRLAVSVDLSLHDVPYETSAPTPEDDRVFAGLAGIEFVPGRGHGLRFLLSAGAGWTRVDEGSRPASSGLPPAETRTSAAYALGAGMRFKTGSHTAVRIQAQWIGMIGTDGALEGLIPIRVHFEF